MSDLIITLQEFTASLPPLLRWVGVMLAALIPYVEAEGAAVIGVVAGLHPALAITFGVLGNAVALLIVIAITSAVRSGVTRNAVDQANPKRVRMRRVFDRYGVPGVSFLGPLLLPSHVTAAAMVGFGASKAKVFVWGVVAVAVWATALTLLVHLGVQAAVS